MSVKVTRCCRCLRRMRSTANWNVDYVAGIEIGVCCPSCQTAEEHLEAEVNEATVDYSAMVVVKPGPNTFVQIIEGLVRTYPDPDVMREKATLLARHRPDMSEMARLMRRIADDMEDGSAYEDRGTRE